MCYTYTIKEKELTIMTTIIAMLSTLNNNDGLTLKRGEPITYKTGWQVADYGMETSSIKEAAEEIMRMQGNCGVWFAEGIYYIDHSFRVNTKQQAMEIGRLHNQISIYGWTRRVLAYC